MGAQKVAAPFMGKGERVLIGNSIIEAMDYYLDPVAGKLLPHHPEGRMEIIEEIWR